MEKVGFTDNEFITFKNSQGISARGVLLKSSQNHIVFETYNPYSVVQLSEVLDNVKICRFRETVYVGKAVVSNLINTGLLLIVSATLVDPWIEDLKPSQIVHATDEARKFVADWQQTDLGVFPEYKLSVNRIRSFLTDVNRWVRQFDTVNGNNIVNEVSEPILPGLTNLFIDFENKAKKVEPSQIGIHKRYVQQELHPLVMQSPFGHRTYHKPLGYAGDYEMVNMMLRSPYEGQTTYAKMLNMFLLKTGPAEAHRNRIDILFQKIKEVAKKAESQGRRARIFNFACGPAAEIEMFVRNERISEICDFTLLDFSKETLDYANSKIDQAKKESGHKNVVVNLVHKSVNDVLRSAVGMKSADFDKLQNFDFIYCAGLFDYLSDKICSKLLNLFLSQLGSDGELLATNVHVDNPVKYMMEYIFEWHLIYRDNKGFSDLINTRNKTVYTDKTGLNVFLEANK